MVFNLGDLINEVWVWVELHWVGVSQIITLRSKWLADVLPIADCLSERGVTSISISRRIQASPSISKHLQPYPASPRISKYLQVFNIRLLLLNRQHGKLSGNLISRKIWSLEGVWSEFTVWEEVNLPRWHLSWFSPLCKSFNLQAGVFFIFFILILSTVQSHSICKQLYTTHNQVNRKHV